MPLAGLFEHSGGDLPNTEVNRPRIEPIPFTGIEDAVIAEAVRRFARDVEDDVEAWPRPTKTSDDLPCDGAWILAADGQMFLFASEGVAGNALIVKPQDCGPRCGFELTEHGTEFRSTCHGGPEFDVYDMPVRPTAALVPMELWMRLDNPDERYRFRAWTRVWTTTVIVEPERGAAVPSSRAPLMRHSDEKARDWSGEEIDPAG